MLKSVLSALFSGRTRRRPRAASSALSRPSDEPDIESAIRAFNASDPAGARAIAEKIVRDDPRHHQAWNLLGAIALVLEDGNTAAPFFERAAALQPTEAAYLSNCGEAYRRAGGLDDAEECCRAALEIDPRHASAHHNLALTLGALGDVEQAHAAFQAALAIRPDFMSARSNLLFLLCHHPGVEPATVLEEHRRWDELHARPIATTTTRPVVRGDSRRPLRIGYVSADLWRHAIAHFLEPLLAHHDPGAFEVFCYHNSRREDDVTHRLRACVPHWRDVAGSNDEAVARQVVDDGIDILVDLSGHTAGNRLCVFARKPAPVQVSYLGYLNTTGLQCMDFRITDVHADPPGASEAWHTERLLRMPHSQWCYRPPQDTPDINPLPASARGTVTFGSLHNLKKINRSVIELWARLLERHPDSELLIAGLPAGATSGRLRERFAALGVEPARLQLIDKCNFDEYWRLYHRIDIALDAFPYNGATTTCESLWMGVPVVTLAGRYAAARSGASLLTSAGHPELIAESPEQYVGIAAGLASDVQRLARLRASLRPVMQQSPLMDEAGHTRAFEALLRGAIRGAAAAGT